MRTFSAPRASLANAAAGAYAQPLNSPGPGFVVLYRWRLHTGAEEAFVAAWSRITELLRAEGGSLGSRLHRGSDGCWYSYAQWPSEAAREKAFAQGSLDPSVSAKMRAAIAESLPELVLESVADFMLPAPNNVTVSESEVGLRLADASDALCLGALGTQVFFETYATSGIRLALAREAAAQFSPAAFTQRLGEPRNRIVLAELSGHFIAFAEVSLGAKHALVPQASAAELSRLYVQSPFLRQGVGRQLLKQAEALASAEGASTLWLTAWVGNKRALAFYASQGYVQVGSTEYTFEGESFENRLFAKALRAET